MPESDHNIVKRRRLSTTAPPHVWSRACLAGFSLALATACAVQGAQSDDAIARGKYIFDAAGCAGCHTDKAAKGPLLAGGRTLKTPFGTFYGPNITPDRTYGIGTWSDDDFRGALRDGVSPDGANLYPVFPYPSFAKMSDRDILDLKAYIFSLPPVAQPSRPHEINFPLGWRFLMTFWKWMFFEPAAMTPDPGRSPEVARGAYLVEALGHCGECHTARGWLGQPNESRKLAGTTDGPDGGKVPNITPDPDTGIGEWPTSDIVLLLKTGILPDGDVVGSVMGEVVDASTSRLTDEDRLAIAAYLRTVPPIRNRVGGAAK